MLEFIDLAEYAVNYALKLGVKYVEARLQNDIKHTYILKNGNPEAIGISREKGISIRVLINGGLGFSSVNVVNRDFIKDAVKTAVSMAKASVKLLKKPIGLSEERIVEDEWEVKEKRPLESVSIEDKLEYLYNIDKIVSSEKEIGISIPMRVLELSEWFTEKYFVNSDGTRIKSKTPRIKFICHLTAVDPEKGSEQEFIEKGGCGGWEIVENWDLIDYMENKAKTLGRIVREGKTPPSGKLDVVLGSSIVGLAVHESTGHPYEADRILGREAAQAGESFVKPNMIGYTIGSEIVNVVDDPTIEGSFGYYLYDDEGVKARRRYLIKNGVINEFLHNRETAYEFGVSSNAAARASSFDREPIVRMANTFMLAGDYTLEELVEDIKIGVFMKTFGEWNIDDRRFNMRFIGRECYLVENGEIKNFIRRPILEITTPSFYKSIDAISKNLAFDAATCGKGDPPQGVPVWTGGPEIRLRNVRLLR